MTKMRQLLPALAAAAAVVGLAGTACAQATATTSASGSIAVMQPITLAKNTDLSFGTVIRPASGNGTVTVDPSTGARSVTGGIGTVNNGPITAVTRATFTVGGEGGSNFTVTVPASFAITRNGNQDPITVTLTSTAASGTLSNAFGTAGSSTFGVGGQLSLSNGTPSGSYTGTFSVTVAYN